MKVQFLGFRFSNSQFVIRNPKFFVFFCALLFAFCFPAEAQQPAKIPRIGYLSGSFGSTSPDRREAFRQGLRELGYVGGEKHCH
jgi:hypothetical protein